MLQYMLVRQYKCQTYHVYICEYMTTDISVLCLTKPNSCVVVYFVFNHMYLGTTSSVQFAIFICHIIV